MRVPLKFFFAVCLAAVGLLLIQSFLIPFLYKIKEPFFMMPVATAERPGNPAGLSLRCDEYGDGRFGAKRKNGRRHAGIDLAAKIKSPVYASKSGWARGYRSRGGYGNLVIIDHPGGWQTRYGHLDKIAIKKSRWVRQGTVIGSVGKSGNADARGIIPHLHFEIRYKGKPIDPANELTKEATK